eukprot:Nitzschia sp. Nitz4//scaffold53_size117307//21917//23650//NITZ4_003758-RA/size117307-processed-gene-0.149-mRNA-1//-1//CDS//3329554169//8242//frame0
MTKTPDTYAISSRHEEPLRAVMPKAFRPSITPARPPSRPVSRPKQRSKTLLEAFTGNARSNALKCKPSTTTPNKAQIQTHTDARDVAAMFRNERLPSAGPKTNSNSIFKPSPASRSTSVPRSQSFSRKPSFPRELLRNGSRELFRNGSREMTRNGSHGMDHTHLQPNDPRGLWSRPYDSMVSDPDGSLESRDDEVKIFRHLGREPKHMNEADYDRYLDKFRLDRTNSIIAEATVSKTPTYQYQNRHLVSGKNRQRAPSSGSSTVVAGSRPTHQAQRNVLHEDVGLLQSTAGMQQFPQTYDGPSPQPVAPNHQIHHVAMNQQQRQATPSPDSVDVGYTLQEILRATETLNAKLGCNAPPHHNISGQTQAPNMMMQQVPQQAQGDTGYTLQDILRATENLNAKFECAAPRCQDMPNFSQTAIPTPKLSHPNPLSHAIPSRSTQQFGQNDKDQTLQEILRATESLNAKFASVSNRSRSEIEQQEVGEMSNILATIRNQAQQLRAGANPTGEKTFEPLSNSPIGQSVLAEENAQSNNNPGSAVKSDASPVLDACYGIQGNNSALGRSMGLCFGGAAKATVE